MLCPWVTGGETEAEEDRGAGPAPAAQPLEEGRPWTSDFPSGALCLRSTSVCRGQME